MERGHRISILWASVALLALTFSLPSFAQANLSGQWNTMQYQMPINPVHMSLMNNGKVLVASGSGNVPGNTDFESAVWDPIAGTITTQPVTWDMFCNGMVVLPDGRPFVVGGTLQYDPFYGSANASIFDPVTNLFSNTAPMSHGRWYPTATVLSDGRVMVFSGLKENGVTSNLMEFYSITAGWSTAIAAGWTPPLYPRMHLLPNGTVFYSGPGTTSNIFNPSTNKWTMKVATTNFHSARTYGSSVLLPLTPANNYTPKVIIFGGSSPSTATTEIIDLSAATPQWQWGPNMSQPRIEMNAVILPTGKVLALGGSGQDEQANTASLNADLYDPASNTFSSAGANSYPRLYHSNAMLLPDATVAVAGGNPVRGSYEPHLEIYQPAYLFTTDTNGNPVPATRPVIAGAPVGITYGGTFTVQTPDAANISSIALIRASAVTHAFDMDQRMVGLSFAAGQGSLTVTGPPSSNIAPPGYYLLFLINSSGVPSVASFVQVAAPADFGLGASPATLTVTDGAKANFTATVSPTWNYSGSVNLSVTGLPGATTATFSVNPVTGSKSSTLTIANTGNAPAGSYPLTITATDGTITHTANVTLNLTRFDISVAPASQVLPIGSTNTYTVTVTPSGAFNGVVNLKVGGLPSGVTGSYSPTSITGAGTSTLTLTAAPTALPKTKVFTVSGVGQVTRTASATVVVQ